MNLKLYLFLFLLTVFGTHKTNGQNSIDSTVKTVPFTVFKTNDNSLTIKDILTKDFQFVNQDSISEKTKPIDVYWIKIDLDNELETLKQDSIWYLLFRGFEYASIYTQEDGSIIERKFGRFENEAKNRTILNTPGISFKSESLINKHFLYLKVKRVVAFNSLKNWTITYQSQENEYLLRHYYSYNNLKSLIPVYIFSGICLVMFILTLTFYLYSKRKEFLFYMLYNLFLFFYLTADILKLHDFFFGGFNLISYAFFQVAQVAINLFYILFIINYLNTREKYTKLHIGLQIIAYVLTLIIILDSVFFISEYFIGHIYILNIERIIMTLFGLLGMVYLLFKAKDKLAYFIVIASFLYMIGALGLLFFSQRLYMIIGSSFEILIFASGLAYKIQGEYKEKLHFEKETNIQRSKALRAQINPHFIFNSLSSIQNLIISNNKANALKYLSKFSHLTRAILENSIESEVLLSEDIKILEDYLELESLRFDGAFTYKINIDPSLDVEAIEVPALIMQPFVENAILHGLLNKKEGSKCLTIDFKQISGYLICEIEDNGIGRKATLKKESIHTSRGVQLTIDRLKSLNKDNQDFENIKIIDKTDKNGIALGTKVIIYIPI